MESSILKSTKKMLGLDFDYTAFDEDVIICINSAFASLNQLGVGPQSGFYIEDETRVWEDFMVNGPQLNLVKTFIFLKVRMMFDPPATSFAITAMESQIREHEWRLNTMREDDVVGPLPPQGYNEVA